MNWSTGRNRSRPCSATGLGKSRGVTMTFDLSLPVSEHQGFEVYTTGRTPMGVTHLTLATQHPIALECAKDNPALAEFIRDCQTQQVTEAGNGHHGKARHGYRYHCGASADRRHAGLGQ